MLFLVTGKRPFQTDSWDELFEMWRSLQDVGRESSSFSAPNISSISYSNSDMGSLSEFESWVLTYWLILSSKNSKSSFASRFLKFFSFHHTASTLKFEHIYEVLMSSSVSFVSFSTGSMYPYQHLRVLMPHLSNPAIIFLVLVSSIDSSSLLDKPGETFYRTWVTESRMFKAL